MLLDLVKFKLGFANNDPTIHIFNSKNRDFYVANFLDLYFEGLQLPKLVQRNQFFPIKDDTEILIAFKCNNILKKQICNYSYYYRNLDKIYSLHCLCDEEGFRDFVDVDKGHIVSDNLDIIKDHSLKFFMEKGTKFRLRPRVNIKNNT